MAEADWTYLNDGLDIATVDRGVTAGIARPPGGGSFLFAFNSLAAVQGAVGLFCNLVDFAPMAKAVEAERSGIRLRLRENGVQHIARGGLGGSRSHHRHTARRQVGNIDRARHFGTRHLEEEPGRPGAGFRRGHLQGKTHGRVRIRARRLDRQSHGGVRVRRIARGAGVSSWTRISRRGGKRGESEPGKTHRTTATRRRNTVSPTCARTTYIPARSWCP